ncbi:MAG: 2-amino-4-hydroxy-6-hydroxymethyldihydropteridine diphosphokinase [Acidimicrobiia bacterium]
MSRRAFLALGSNLGDREGFLQNAVDQLGERHGVVVSRSSRVYETEPLGPSEHAFLNAVVEIGTDLSPRALLQMCHDCEEHAGRVRVVRWGARTLDVDIIWMDGVQLHTPELTIPHPEVANRLFVLVPLADLDRLLAEQLSEFPVPDPTELPPTIVAVPFTLQIGARE